MEGGCVRWLGEWVGESEPESESFASLSPVRFRACGVGVSAGWVSELQGVSPKASRLPAFPRVRLRFSTFSARYSRRSLLTAHLTHGFAVRLRGLLSVVLAVFAVRCSRRSLWSRLARGIQPLTGRCSRFPSVTAHSYGGLPLVGHPSLPVRFRGAWRLAAPGHRPGARL